MNALITRYLLLPLSLITLTVLGQTQQVQWSVVDGLPTRVPLTGITFADDAWFALGNIPNFAENVTVVLRSEDGNRWEKVLTRNNFLSTFSLWSGGNQVVFGGQAQAAMGVINLTMVSDAQGRNWTPLVGADPTRSLPTPPRELSFGNGRWVALVAGGIFTSDDLVNWNQVFGDVNGTQFSWDVAGFADGQWVVLGIDDIFPTVAVSRDGVNWDSHVIPGIDVTDPTRFVVFPLRRGGGQWVAFASVDFSGPFFFLRSQDGRTWETAPGDDFFQPGIAELTSFDYGAGQWIGVGNGISIASSDGLSWQRRNDLPASFSLNNIRFAKGRWVAIGNDGTALVGEPANQAATLAAARQGNDLAIQWSSTLSGWVLESADAIDSAFKQVDVEPDVIDGLLSVSLPTTSPMRYFRLRKTR